VIARGEDRFATDPRGQPRVSVVIPTIGRRELRAAVDSILRQSVVPHEIVVVNDSPEQHSVTAGLGGDVVEVFTGGGHGPSVARNRGVERAQGELIAYLDDDDWWFPHHIASALHTLELHPELDLYSCTVFQAHPDRLKLDSKVIYRGREDVIDFFYGRACWAQRRRSIAPSTWVFRRETCDLPMDETVGHYEDVWWLFNLDKRKKVIRQYATPGGVKFEHPPGAAGRHIVRREPEVLIHWAQLMESLRKGAGQRFIIGAVGREYARKGMRDEWAELMGIIPREWRISADYRLVRAIEKRSLRRQRNREGEAPPFG
jgi:glycosyltransferase involved in cell wall biosynthesis